MSSSSNRSSSAAALLLLAFGGHFAPAESPAKHTLWEIGSVSALLEKAPEPWRSNQRFQRIIRAFADAYPSDFVGIEYSPDQGPFLLLSGETKLRYDDGVARTHSQRLEAPDIEDTFFDLYPLANPTDRLPENFDPGRYRVDAMFMSIYGRTEAEVRANCQTIDFCGHRVPFNTRAGAAEALRRVAAELEPLIKAQPELAPYFEKLGGTFAWRKVAGTDRLSNHAFAVAIDLNVERTAYWRWQSPARLPAFSRLGFPQAIIETFERHGFVWGGKWYHYDTMHFEYRPEILHFARSAPAP
jgi:hypothetical protein